MAGKAKTDTVMEAGGVEQPLYSESVPSRHGQTSGLASAQAPYIYFDSAAAWAVQDGVVFVTLDALRLMPHAEGVRTDGVVVAHLRMSLAAAKRLRGALDTAILAGEQPQEGTKPN